MNFLSVISGYLSQSQVNFFTVKNLLVLPLLSDNFGYCEPAGKVLEDYADGAEGMDHSGVVQ